MTHKEEEFWAVVWKRHGDLVIVEEAAMNVARDRELTPVFTSLRHNHHKLIIIGHDGTDLLPVMRRQLDTLYLFVQPAKALEIWAQDLPQFRGLEAAATLNQYEFLRCQAFGTAEKRRLQL